MFDPSVIVIADALPIEGLVADVSSEWISLVPVTFPVTFPVTLFPDPFFAFAVLFGSLSRGQSNRYELTYQAPPRTFLVDV